jgi:aminoglycoside phosphotransferase (APT) family kinase protein
MTASNNNAAWQVLGVAAERSGVRADGATLIRHGSNTLYSLPGGVVARISRPGGSAVAEREVRIARWLADSGVPVVRPLPGAEQASVVGDRAVTWWEKLPPHRDASPAELGAVLRQLHALPVPRDLGLVEFDPLDELTGNIAATGNWLAAEDRTWLHSLLGRLTAEYAQLSAWHPPCLLHGDAWQGNVAVPEHGPPVLLDLEQVGIGDPVWDLAPLAVDYADFSRVPDEEYAAFIGAYGSDITTWAGFRTVATICEVRWTAFVLSKADGANRATHEARHRLACLRGEVQRPWSWSAF